MINIKINDLISIMEARLSTILFDSFLDILHPDGGQKSNKQFEYILRNAITQYSIHFSNVVTSLVSLKAGHYDFVSNFSEYLNNPSLSEDDIILIPEYILNIGYNRLSTRMPISKKYYDYKKPRLTSRIKSTVFVTYGTSYPLILKYGPDGNFTDDSVLYYIDEQSYSFITRLEYELLHYIKNMQSQIEIPDIGVKILNNLDDQLDRVKTELDTWVDTSSHTINFWGS